MNSRPSRVDNGLRSDSAVVSRAVNRLLDRKVLPEMECTYVYSSSPRRRSARASAPGRAARSYDLVSRDRIIVRHYNKACYMNFRLDMEIDCQNEEQPV